MADYRVEAGTPQQSTGASAQAQPSNANSKSSSPEGPIFGYAEWYTICFALLALAVWLWFLPRRSSSVYDVPEETELCQKIAYAEQAIGEAIVLPSGCVGNAGDKNKKGGIKSAFYALPASAAVPHTFSASSPADPRSLIEELRIDHAVWTRYESELKTFQWGQDLNWYIYSSLRVLVIVLSAIAPALIVAPVLKERKFLAAFPAALVAVGAGCISEFDFKEQSAAHTVAWVQVQGEKTAFLARSAPLYSYTGAGESPSTGAPVLSQTIRLDGPLSLTSSQAGGTSPLPPQKLQGRAADKSKSKDKSRTSQPKPTTVSGTVAESGCGTTDGVVPYPDAGSYFKARSNFVCRLQQIWQVQNGERVLFLRGQQGHDTAKNQ